MELDLQVLRLYYEAQNAIEETMGLKVPTDRIIVQSMPRNKYTVWAKERDYKGFHRREAADRIGLRKKQEDDGKQEVGLCEIISSDPITYRVTISYPDMPADNRKLWKAVVFGTAAHELAHVWDYENTRRGIRERDALAVYASAQEGMAENIAELKKLVPDLKMPDELHTYSAYEETAAQYLSFIASYVNYCIVLGKVGQESALDTAAQIQIALKNFHESGIALASRGKLPMRERELQEGWAEYVKWQALEWFYEMHEIGSLEPLPAGCEFATGLQQMELWKDPKLEKRLLKPSKVEPFMNGAYTNGFVKLNRLNKDKVKEFILKAIKDEELPEF